MKNRQMFPGIILIGFGAYFFLQQSKITLFQNFFTWPTLIIIVGIAFLAQGYLEKEYESILPGIVLLGFGLHFHLAGRFTFWPDNSIGPLILILSLGFFLRFLKTRSGLFQALLFFIWALLLLFFDRIAGYFGLVQHGIAQLFKYWPALAIVVGIYFLMKKKK